MQRCPVCKQGSLRDASFEHTLELADVEFVGTVDGTECDVCGESFVSPDELQRFELLVADAVARKGLISGETFRFLRKALGLRATDLALRLGVTPETISRWEQGHRDVSRAAFAVLGNLVADARTGSEETRRRLDAMMGPSPKLPKKWRLDDVA